MEDKKNVSKRIIIGLLGETSVGKTAICNSLIGLEFVEEMVITIGTEKFEKFIEVKNNEKIKAVIWDTSGTERFRSPALNTMRTMRNADGIILVFDFSYRKSFVELDVWLKSIKENLNVSSIILFGNKADLNKSEWQVTSEEVNKYVKEKGIPYFEVSAKTGRGLNEGLLYIVNEIYDKKFDSKDNNIIKINENDIEKEKKNSDCVRNKKNKK